MIAAQNQGMNLTVAESSSVASGTYYEMRVRTNSTAANVTMMLDQFGSDNEAPIMGGGNGDAASHGD
jgi:hypothetical protein